MQVEAFVYHRVIMAFSLAALACKQQITIKDVKNVKTSFPNFVAMAKKAGLVIDEA